MTLGLLGTRESLRKIERDSILWPWYISWLFNAGLMEPWDRGGPDFGRLVNPTSTRGD